jgi:hypothetical protein
MKPAMVAGFELWSTWQDNSRTGLINFGLSDLPFKRIIITQALLEYAYDE